MSRHQVKNTRWTSLDQYDNLNTLNKAKRRSARSTKFQNGRQNAATLAALLFGICPSTAVFQQAIPGPYGHTVSQAHLPDQGINSQSKTGAALKIKVKTPKTSQDYPKLVKC